MFSSDGILYCDGCGVEISWQPVILQPQQAHLPIRHYCCQLCRDAPADRIGAACPCAERSELEDERRVAGVEW